MSRKPVAPMGTDDVQEVFLHNHPCRQKCSSSQQSLDSQVKSSPAGTKERAQLREGVNGDKDEITEKRRGNGEIRSQKY